MRGRIRGRDEEYIEFDTMTIDYQRREGVSAQVTKKIWEKCVWKII